MSELVVGRGDVRSTGTPEPMSAALGYALIDLVIKSDPEAQQLMARVESPLERVWFAVFYPTIPPNTMVEVQKQIGPYRVDFLVASWLVVEVDGYQFHMVTREQAIRDRKRDRYMVTRGYAIMRFAGYEVWDDPWACAQEVQDYLATLEHDADAS